MTFNLKFPPVPAGLDAQLRTYLEEFQVKAAIYLDSIKRAGAGYQPLDADLTAIAALATTSYGRAFLALADAAAARTATGTVIGTNVQAWDSDLDAIAALTTAAFGRSLLTQASATAARATLGASGTSFSWFVQFGNRPNNSTAGTLAAADGSISDATDMDGHVIGRNMADAARTDLSFMFVVPDELDTTAAVTALAYYRLAAAGTSRNVEIEITARVAGDTNVTVSGGTQFDIASAKSVNAYASGALVVHNLGTVFGANTLATRSIVHGTVFRDAQAGNADDNFANTINFLAVQFIGTRVTT